jgi:hypothetical protein
LQSSCNSAADRKPHATGRGKQLRQNLKSSGARARLDLQAHENRFSTRCQRDCGLLGIRMMMSAALIAWRALLKARSFPSRATGLIGFIMYQPGSASRQTNHPSRIHERLLWRCQPSVIILATNPAVSICSILFADAQDDVKSLRLRQGQLLSTGGVSLKRKLRRQSRGTRSTLITPVGWGATSSRGLSLAGWAC